MKTCKIRGTSSLLVALMLATIGSSAAPVTAQAQAQAQVLVQPKAAMDGHDAADFESPSVREAAAVVSIITTRSEASVEVGSNDIDNRLSLQGARIYRE